MKKVIFILLCSFAMAAQAQVTKMLIGKDTININRRQNLDSARITLNTATLAGKQATLVSGTNIKSINGTSLLGSGNFVISGSVNQTTDYNWTGTHTFTKNSSDAIVTMQNTQPYGTGGVYTQYAQKWLTSSGAIAGYVSADISRLVFNSMVQAPQFYVANAANGFIDGGQGFNAGLGLTGSVISFSTNIYAAGGSNKGAWFTTNNGGLVIDGEGAFVTDVTSSKFTVKSVLKGSLPAPRMTTIQKLAIASPAEGLEVYDLTLHQKSYYNGTTWINY